MEIKFRIFDKSIPKDEGELDNQTGMIIKWDDIIDSTYFIDAIKGYFPLMQFTGIKDKKGNEIYEGDILKDPEGLGVVYYYPPAFICQTPTGTFSLAKGLVNVTQLEETEIIGNIYETPELLK